MATTPDPAAQAPTATADAPGRRSLVGTWTEVVADAGGLIRAEARLARMETADNLKAVGRGSAAIGAGAVLLMLALVFVTVAAVAALAVVIGLIWALLGVAVVCAALGIWLLNAGQARLSGQKILPERTLKRMSNDLDRLAARASVPVTPPASASGGGNEGA